MSGDDSEAGQSDTSSVSSCSPQRHAHPAADEFDDVANLVWRSVLEQQQRHASEEQELVPVHEMDSSVASDDEYQASETGSVHEDADNVVPNPIGERTRARAQPQNQRPPLPPRLPAAIRDAQMRLGLEQPFDGYDINSPFIRFEAQTTDRRGFHERATDLQRAIEETNAEDLQNAMRNEDAPRGNMAGFGQARMGEEEQDFCQQMMVDMANDQVTYVPVQLPQHRAEHDQRMARFRDDGITDVNKAVQECPICNTDLNPRYADNLSAAKVEFLDLSMPGMPGKIARCREAANTWNVKLAEPCNRLKPGSMPYITPSMVEIHMEECDESSLVVMNRLIRSLLVVHSVVEKGGLFVNKRIAGTRTDDYSVSASAWRVVKELNKELRENIKTRDILQFQQRNRNIVESVFARAAGEKPKGGHGNGGRTKIMGMNGIAGLDVRGKPVRPRF